MEFTTLGGLVRRVYQGLESCLESDDITRVCGNDGVLIWIPQGMARWWLDMDIFRVLRRIYWNPIMAFLVIARLEETDWDATCVKWSRSSTNSQSYYFYFRSLEWRVNVSTERKQLKVDMVRSFQFIVTSKPIVVNLAISVCGPSACLSRTVTTTQYIPC